MISGTCGWPAAPRATWWTNSACAGCWCVAAAPAAARRTPGRRLSVPVHTRRQRHIRPPFAHLLAQVSFDTADDLAAAAGSLAARFPRLARIDVKLQALERLDDADAARLAAGLAAAGGVEELDVDCSSKLPGPQRPAGWLQRVLAAVGGGARLRGLVLRGLNGDRFKELPALASLPALAELAFDGRLEEGDAAPAVVCAGVTELTCSFNPSDLGSLSAAFPAVADATLRASGLRHWRILPAPPASAWPGLRRLTLRFQGSDFEFGVEVDLPPLLRQLCGAGAGPLPLQKLQVCGDVFFGDAELAELLHAAPDLECLQLGCAAELHACITLTDGAFLGVHHGRLRRLGFCTGWRLNLSTPGLLAMGRALPALESLVLGGTWFTAEDGAEVKAAQRLDRECGGDGSCERLTASDRRFYDDEDGLGFEELHYGGALLRAIRSALERGAGGGGAPAVV